MKPNVIRTLEIDYLRGFAIIFMLINHFTVPWMSSDNQQGFLGVIFFIGSFAPVVFFFVTGMGYGISHVSGSVGSCKPVLYKASILVFMDAFMRSQFNFFQGWDFLAFIAFSMVLLQLLKGRSYALSLSIFLIVCLFLLRYILPIVFTSIATSGEADYLIKVIVGTRSISGVSYWFVPWLIYSLMGFTLGLLFVKYHNFIVRKNTLLSVFLIVSGFLILFFSLYLNEKGMIYFRWGRVSINFFIISLAALAILLFLSFGVFSLNKDNWFVQKTAISGIASLAVVPIHYFLIAAVEGLYTGSKSEVYFYTAGVPFVVINIFLAGKLDILLRLNKHKITHSMAILMCLAICLCALIIQYVESYIVDVSLTLLAQIILCTFLLLPYNFFMIRRL